MNRPILIVVIGYIIGILWGLYLQTSIVLLYIFLAIIYIIINFKYKKKKFKILSIKRHFRYLKLIFKINTILVVVISSFISNSIIKYQESKYDKIYQLTEVNTTGIIVSNKEEKEYKNRYKIKLENGINFYLDTELDIELHYGDKVKIAGEYQEPQEARNYKGFDYKQYLKTLKIYGTIKAENVKLLEKNAYNPILQGANNIFLKIKENIENTYNEQTQGLMLGILLGYTKNIDEEIKENFSESNISHVLSVSGMHVSYIIFLVTNSTKNIFGKRSSKIISSVVLVLYMFITGFSVSVVRACIMGIISCMSFVLYRKNNTINNIAISILIILISNPFNMISLSFLLTYGGTIGILFFKNNIEKFLKNIKIRNRKWKYIFIKIQRKCQPIIDCISVSISAQIVIAPIILWNFNTIGISFLICNLLLNLVVGIIVMGGLIQAIITFINFKIGHLIAYFLQIPIYILIPISKLGTKIPFGNFKVVTPYLIQIIIYYFLIILINYLYKIFHKRNLTVTENRIKNLIHVFKFKIKPYKKKILYILVFCIFILFVLSKLPKDLKIYFIDVGQGDSTLIVTPKEKVILIDGGGSQTYDVGKNTLLPYLLDRRIRQIDYLIVSHFDFDHCRNIKLYNERNKSKKCYYN